MDNMGQFIKDMQNDIFDLSMRISSENVADEGMCGELSGLEKALKRAQYYYCEEYKDEATQQS